MSASSLVRRFDADLFEALSSTARENPRRRQNLNLHASTEEAVQRFFNAIEPESYVMPHRHLDQDKAETIAIMRGRLGVILFGQTGEIDDCIMLAPNGENSGLHIPPGVWHSVVAMEAGSVMLEIKAGPFVPLRNDERAPWAPADNSPEATAYATKLKRYFDSD